MTCTLESNAPGRGDSGKNSSEGRGSREVKHRVRGGWGCEACLGHLCRLESLDFLLCVTGRHWRFQSECELHYKQPSWASMWKTGWKRVSGQRNSPVRAHKGPGAQTAPCRSGRSLRYTDGTHTHLNLQRVRTLKLKERSKFKVGWRSRKALGRKLYWGLA